MSKSTYVALSVVILAAALHGCQTGGGVDDKALLTKCIDQFREGAKTKNVDLIMSGVSEDFMSGRFGDKQSYRDAIENGVDQGFLDGAEISYHNAEFVIEKDTATVYPVELEAAFGTATIRFEMKKEPDGVWRAVMVDIEGI